MRSQWRTGQLASVAVRNISGRGYINPQGMTDRGTQISNDLLGTANGRDIAAAFETDEFHDRLGSMLSEAVNAIDPVDPSTHFRVAQSSRTLADNPQGLFTALDAQHKYVMFRAGDTKLDDNGKALYEKEALRVAIPTFLHGSYPIPKWASQAQSALGGGTVSSMIWPLLFPQKYDAIVGSELPALYDGLKKGVRTRLGSATVEALTDVRRNEFAVGEGRGVYHAIIQGTLPNHIFTGFLIWVKGYTPDGRTFTAILGRGVDVIPIIQSLGNIEGGILGWSAQQDVSDALFRTENQHLFNEIDFSRLAFDKDSQRKLDAIIEPRTRLLRTALNSADYLAPFLTTIKNADIVRRMAGQRQVVPPGWDDIDPQLLLKSGTYDDLTLETATREIFGCDFIRNNEISDDFHEMEDEPNTLSDAKEYGTVSAVTLADFARSMHVDSESLTSPTIPVASDTVAQEVIRAQKLPDVAARALIQVAEASQQVPDFRQAPPVVETPPQVPEMQGMDMNINTGTENIFTGRPEEPFGPEDPSRDPVVPESHEGTGGGGEGHGRP